MNDRFKFRVFLKAHNQMCNVHTLHTGTNKVIISTRYGNRSVQINESNILMQCTGLKDKNGKLIYEGDIVRYSEYNIEDIEPEWEYDEIIWGDKYSYPAFDFKNGNLFDCNGLSYIFNEGWTIEVIGNIYENKELLE